MSDNSTETANHTQEDKRERQLKALYQQPHTARERHYGLMDRGSPSPAAAEEVGGEGAHALESEAIADTIELREAVLLSPERREVEVTVLESGVSRNGWSYSPELLQTATPLFEGARAFADHPGPADRAERSIRDIVGYYHSPRFEAGPQGQPARIKACLRVLESAHWLWTMIAEAVADGQPFVGLSVDFLGAVKPGRRGAAVREVQAIRQLLSVDVVTRPSAGGRFERILNAIHEEEPMTPIAEDDSLSIEYSALSAAQALLAEAQRERRIAECARTLDALLSGTKLPEPFRDKVRKRFAGSEADAEAIQEAIDDETEALASVAAEGLITGMGAEKAALTSRTALDRFQTALDIMLGVDIISEAERSTTPKLSGIREAYILATGDPDIHGATDFERALIREADTTTSSFGFLLGTSMNKRLLKEYQAWPNEWLSLIHI